PTATRRRPRWARRCPRCRSAPDRRPCARAECSILQPHKAVAGGERILVSKSSFTSKLIRDPRQRAELYSREGRPQKAAEMYARAGDFRQAARLAIEAGDERLAVDCSLKAAFGVSAEGQAALPQQLPQTPET